MVLSLQLESAQEETRRQHLVEVRPSRKVIVARPGSRVGLALHVESRFGLYVRLVVEGLESSIARYTLAPEQARAPFTSRLRLTVTPNAVGVYPFKVTALDPAGSSYGASSLVLVVLPRELLPEILGHLQAILAYYKAYGIQYVIWYLLIHFYRDKGITFTEVKALYEFLRRKRLSNGTVGDLLERMERKGIIVKRYGKYYAGVEDEKLVLETIDVRRVKAGRRGARQLVESLTENSPIERSATKEKSIPLAVKRVLRVAEELIEQGETRKALGLIQHTLIGVRKTGRWLLWVKGIFVYHEKKAKPSYHYFRSEKLARILRSMGLRQGFIHAQLVHDLIHMMFPGGYREARRIHYLLKSIGWITYGPPLILYIAIYSNNIGGFKIESINGEIITSVNYSPRRATKIFKTMIMSGEHVDEYNDNTYFKYR